VKINIVYYKLKLIYFNFNKKKCFKYILFDHGGLHLHMFLMRVVKSVGGGRKLRKSGRGRGWTHMQEKCSLFVLHLRLSEQLSGHCRIDEASFWNGNGDGDDRGRDVFGCEPVKGYIASITQHHMCRQLARTITRTREIKPGKHTQVLAQILTLSPLVEFSLALSWRIGKAIPIQLSFGSPFILFPFSPFIL